jgi:hypothetical protein
MVARPIVILASLLLAVLMISAAFLFSSPKASPNLVSATDTEALLKEYASRDTDNDGLYDWEESLYGTDPSNPNSYSKDMTDGEAVAEGSLKPATREEEEVNVDEIIAGLPGVEAAPGTITREFARSFISDYIKTQSIGTSQEKEVAEAFVASSLAKLLSEHALKDPYGQEDVRLGTSGTVALRTYVASVEQTITSRPLDAESDPAVYFDVVVRTGDESAQKKLALLSNTYTEVTKAMLNLSVPPEALPSHLALVNALSHMGTLTGNMAKFSTDPLRGFIGLAQYEQGAEALTLAFSDTGTLFYNAKITFSPGEAGYFFWSIAEGARLGVLQVEQKAQTAESSQP